MTVLGPIRSTTRFWRYSKTINVSSSTMPSMDVRGYEERMLASGRASLAGLDGISWVTTAPICGAAANMKRPFRGISFRAYELTPASMEFRAAA